MSPIESSDSSPVSPKSTSSSSCPDGVPNINTSFGSQSDTLHDDSNSSAATKHDDSDAIPDPEAELHDLLSRHADLKTWLQYTGFFDLEHRREKLDYVRELNGLEAERAKVLLKIRHSRPSEQTLPDASAGSVLPRRLQEQGKGNGKGQVQEQGQGQGQEHDAAVYATADAVRSSGLNLRSRSEHRLAVPMGPAGQHHLPLRAASRKDTRYFLVKSSNTTNVYMSRRDCLWITQAKNGPLFTQAFRECKSVVLFFSINKSKAFQGYAKMTSPPDPNIPLRSWITSTTRDMHTTHPFRVDWINESETPFVQLGELKSPYNEYHPVYVGRDGQEFSEDCGRRMMQVMDRVKSAEGLASPALTTLSPPPAQVGKASRRPDGKRHLAASTIGMSSRSNQANSVIGLGGSRWKKAASSSFLPLSPEPVDLVSEDLLLDYP
ncbi:hypothetical protein QQS21_000908 [Conoideocrella luteorostrata]|uniref:YTH domain-containing protein n=1 Tax=Conoideocrella luteorostrata TaxID=1105319 RepID=A0AAJ0D0B9_9HYPO|nr:hypothetical protein QQS21_000908 [Conoideocrella luteorostrata]